MWRVASAGRSDAAQYSPAQASVQRLSTQVLEQRRLELRRRKGEVGKLRTTRGKKTSQILGLRHAKVLLATGEMASNVNDLAMALLSSSKDMDGRI